MKVVFLYGYLGFLCY